MILANTALPSFIAHGIVFTILLPLVAAIEAVVLVWLLKIPPAESFFTAARANWRSTIRGLPAGWLMAMCGLIPAGIFVLFLPPAYRDPGSQIIVFTALTGGIIPTKFTMVAIPAANLLILFPYYIASVRVERKVVQSRHPEIDPIAVLRAVRWMNRVSYVLLALLVLWWLTAAISQYYDSAGRAIVAPSAAITRTWGYPRFSSVVASGRTFGSPQEYGRAGQLYGYCRQAVPW